MPRAIFFSSLSGLAVGITVCGNLVALRLNGHKSPKTSHGICVTDMGALAYSAISKRGP